MSFDAFANLIPHARAGHVRWKAAFIFAATGVLGAYVGSSLGKATNGQHLLVRFALLMLVVAGFMLRGRRSGVDCYPLPGMVPRPGAVGVATGSLAGFFGIGGGFLIVPGLMFAGGMEIIYAIAPRCLRSARSASPPRPTTRFPAWSTGRWRLSSSPVASPVAGSVRSVRNGWRENAARSTSSLRWRSSRLPS